MAYTELVATWSGVSGLPGYSKFRFIGELTPSQLNSAAANLRTFWDAIKATLPGAVTITIQPGASFHADDGTLTGETSITTPPTAVVGTGGSVYSAASGYMVLWNTGAINGGKKVRGRTYFVPTSTLIFESNGTITAANVTAVQAAATAFATSTPSPAINSRARPGNPSAGNQTNAVLSGQMVDKQVVLRSRRD
jgi:hypothetical protein